MFVYGFSSALFLSFFFLHNLHSLRRLEYIEDEMMDCSMNMCRMWSVSYSYKRNYAFKFYTWFVSFIFQIKFNIVTFKNCTRFASNAFTIYTRSVIYSRIQLHFHLKIYFPRFIFKTISFLFQLPNYKLKSNDLTNWITTFSSIPICVLIKTRFCVDTSHLHSHSHHKICVGFQFSKLKHVFNCRKLF